MTDQIIDLAMNNAGIRDTARALHISIAVLRTSFFKFKKRSSRNVTTLPLDNLQIQLICEVDEMWSFVDNKKTTPLAVVCMGAAFEADYRSFIWLSKQENAA